MSISLISTAEAVAAATDTITVTSPLGMNVGDTLQFSIAWNEHAESFNADLTADGWTIVSDSVGLGTNIGHVLATRVLVAADLAVASWASTATGVLNNVYGTLTLLRGDADAVALVALAADDPATPVGGYLGVGEGEAPRDIFIDTATRDFETSVDLHFVSGKEAIAQAVQVKLSTLLGEWFLDEELGFPYFTQVLVKAPNEIAIRELYRRHILAVPGVLSVLTIDVEFDAQVRSLSLAFTVNTELGEFDATFTPALAPVTE